VIHIALEMLLGDRAKYAGLIFGMTFTAFLVTFAASYFAGFMTNGFALITENAAADVWVMSPVVSSVQETTNMPSSSLARVRSVPGVESAVPLALGTVEAIFANGRFQPFQVIGVDDATLSGVPVIKDGGSPTVLRAADAVIVDPGGTSGKLDTPVGRSDQWPRDQIRLDVPTRELAPGDELLVNDRRVVVVGRSQGIPRYPPRPLLYTTLSNASRILPPERRRLTFVLVTAAPGTTPRRLAERIEAVTGLRARSSADFKTDTVRWIMVNSEDVGDIAAMLSLAVVVGLGVTGVMLYMFTQENRRQYAVLSAMGATPRMLLSMILAQAAGCAVVGTGLGLGICSVAGEVVSSLGFPFRMLWFTPVIAVIIIVIVSAVAVVASAVTVLRLQPSEVFAR
jgi:putative ABC transport system permease protein